MTKRSGIMLCYPFEEKRLAKWKPPYVVQPKFDGVRCRAVGGSDGHYYLFSSEGNEILGVPHINRALDESNMWPQELDGELYTHGMSFEDIFSITSRTAIIHPNHNVMQYYMFELINNDPQALRIKNLSFESRYELQYTANYICYNFDEVMKAYDALIEKGYEGMVVRHIDALYVRKRSVYMMKFKPKKEDHYVIKGYSVEVDIHGEIKEGRLGRLICAGSESQGIKELGKYPPHTKPPVGYFGVGSGLKETDRVNLWNIREHLVGKLLRVQYQHITSGKNVPRFPIFVEVIDEEPKDILIGGR